MKKLVIPLLFIQIVAYAQGPIPRHYEYDESGNRVLRKVIVAKSAYSNPTDSTTNFVNQSEQDQYYEEMFGANKAKVYPNPTNGIVMISFDNPVKDGYYKLYSVSGQLMYESAIQSSSTLIDLSRFNPGVYLLDISCDGISDKWKIIKK